ncbi:unnamed protein product [Parnassius apollo]|uniref:(apollo) hypothetical protein n=1 Tax=Parnassius apollo TaxID=110799 RepID=A0A8S3Y2N7_PARAO|nr:unnamed protein product [Parnassius apollo]
MVEDMPHIKWIFLAEDDTILGVGAARELRSCACATRAAPDDMALGAFARRRNVTLAHSPHFHQVRHGIE